MSPEKTGLRRSIAGRMRKGKNNWRHFLGVLQVALPCVDCILTPLKTEYLQLPRYVALPNSEWHGLQKLGAVRFDSR